MEHDPDLAGRRLGRYRILEKIASGGMGVVYRAHDERLQRDVAVKVLPEKTLDDEARRRFRAEALTLSKLSHPNIAVVHDFNTVEGVDFLVMELVEGMSLASRLQQGPLPERDVLKVGIQIAEAAQSAHEQGIVHRDLKPQNVMVGGRNAVKVLDFGLARWHAGAWADPALSGATEAMTAPDSLAGTLPYMSPEQLRKGSPEPAMDLWGLGVVLYEAATGKRAFPQAGSAELTDAILNRAPAAPRAVNPSVSPELEAVILKCLEKDPELRYQSAREVAVDLRRIGGSTSSISHELPSPAEPGRRWRRPLAVAAGLALLVVILWPVLSSRRPTRTEVAPEPEGDRGSAVAVLPFENLGSPDDAYFADGITEEITSRLAQISGLRVTSRTSALHYAKSGLSLREIGDELGVSSILEGTIRTDRAPDGTGTVRVTPQLIRVADDTHLWADRYTVDLVPGEIFEVQAEIAEQVAEALNVTLLDPEQQAIHRESTGNLAAYDAYLLGRFYWNKRTVEDIRRAVEYFQESVEQDPEFAKAHAGLADAYLLYPTYQIPGITSTEALARAEAAATRALDLDPELAEAHASLASILMNRWDFPSAERHFRRAIELDPRYPVAYYWYAELMLSTGRYESAIALVREAIRLDPASPIAYHLLGVALNQLGRFDEAIEAATRSLELSPDFLLPHHTIAGAHLEEGRLGDYEREIVKIGAPPAAVRAVVMAFRDSLDAGTALHRIEAVWSDLAAPQNRIGVANILALLGEHDRALDLLEQEVKARTPQLVFIRVYPGMKGLESDPRFQAIVSEIGLDYEPQSWP